MNTFGRLFRFHIFGESHGRGVGVVVDGVPPGMPLDPERIQRDLDRRRPGQSRFTTARREPDRLEVLSGAFEGRATGAPLALWIANEDANSRDYDRVRSLPRPGHADWTAHVRSGGFRDHRGGGHASGRLTAALVATGSVAQTLLEGHGVCVAAHLHQVADQAGPQNAHDCAAIRAAVDASLFKTAHLDLVDTFAACVEAAQLVRDSVGGVVEFVAEGLPVGVGEPWVDSVESQLSRLLFAIPAVKGVSFGAGFAAAAMRGSAHNDPYVLTGEGKIRPETNHAGGVLGGLTTGESLWGHVAIKPTSSIARPQRSVNIETMEAQTLELEGRHDPIIAIRAVPVVQAAIAIGLADLMMIGLAERGATAPWTGGSGGGSDSDSGDGGGGGGG